MNDITLRVNTRILERLLWIIIALALIGIIVWTQWDRITGTVSQTEKSDTQMEEKTSTNEAPKTTTSSKTTTKETTQTSASSDGGSIVNGEIQFVIDKMFFKPDTAELGRLKQINFRILNGLKDFTPLIELYVYGDETEKGEPEIKRYDEDKKSVKGEVFSDNVKINIGILDIESLKTLEVVLKDENGNVLKTFKQTFKPSDLDLYKG